MMRRLNIIRRLNVAKRLIGIRLVWLVTFAVIGVDVAAQSNNFVIQTDLKTGGIEKIMSSEDPHKMNWILTSDGSDIAWHSKQFAWGLGELTVNKGGEAETHRWEDLQSSTTSEDGTIFTYKLPNVTVIVTRSYSSNGDFSETYQFKNSSAVDIDVENISINTPLKDWYWGSAKACLEYRCNAHIWTGMHSSYINAMRMGDEVPHLGLVVTDGALADYKIDNIQQDKEWKGWSNFRGDIALRLPKTTLKPNESTSISWRLFWHEGESDFFAKAIDRGFVKGSSDRYHLGAGDVANVAFISKEKLEDIECKVNGVAVDVKQSGNRVELAYRSEKPGDKVITLYYGDKETSVNLHYSIKTADLLEKRIKFIVEKQQLKDRSDPRYGAYMVYDNETNSIYKDHDPNLPSYLDKDEGAERLGMGVSVALWLQQQSKTGKEGKKSKSSKKIEESLLDYFKFVREGLQTEDYKVYSDVAHKSRHRGYNYPWIATLYIELYRVSGDKHYMVECYNTMKKWYKEFGYGFYAINVPIQKSIESLRDAGMTEEAESLLKDYYKVAEEYTKNGILYPAHEVNYEQSIVAPATMFYLEMYLVTKEAKFLEESKRHLALLEAFNGEQPDFHLNEIAIRHWDGYWFGKRAMWGDTMPHYWSALTGRAFILYYLSTGDKEYLRKGKICLENNLTNIHDDGTGSCAYLYPAMVNGEKAKFFDPFANDQDWALYYYLEFLDMVDQE